MCVCVCVCVCGGGQCDHMLCSTFIDHSSIHHPGTEDRSVLKRGTFREATARRVCSGISRPARSVPVFNNLNESPRLQCTGTILQKSADLVRVVMPEAGPTPHSDHVDNVSFDGVGAAFAPPHTLGTHVYLSNRMSWRRHTTTSRSMIIPLWCNILLRRTSSLVRLLGSMK